MKKYVSAAAIALGVLAAVRADEQLDYTIYYKCGLVKCEVGRGSYICVDTPTGYEACVRAGTTGMARKIAVVDDTVRCVMRRGDFAPLSCRQETREKNYRAVVDIAFSHDDGRTRVNVTKERMDKPRRENAAFEVEGVALEPLSVFYYVRHFPEEFYTARATRRVRIVAGTRLEEAEFRCVGRERITVNDVARDTWHVRFVCTHKGTRTKEMEFWITTDAARVPCRVQGELPVGYFICELSARRVFP